MRSCADAARLQRVHGNRADIHVTTDGAPRRSQDDSPSLPVAAFDDASILHTPQHTLPVVDSLRQDAQQRMRSTADSIRFMHAFGDEALVLENVTTDDTSPTRASGSAGNSSSSSTESDEDLEARLESSQLRTIRTTVTDGLPGLLAEERRRHAPSEEELRNAIAAAWPDIDMEEDEDEETVSVPTIRTTVDTRTHFPVPVDVEERESIDASNTTSHEWAPEIENSNIRTSAASDLMQIWGVAEEGFSFFRETGSPSGNWSQDDWAPPIETTVFHLQWRELDPHVFPWEARWDGRPPGHEECSTPDPGDSKFPACLICTVRPANATFVHGDTGHTACCMVCALELSRRGESCPVCRQRFTNVIRNFMS